jgi:hypothetical protein
VPAAVPRKMDEGMQGLPRRLVRPDHPRDTD